MRYITLLIFFVIISHAPWAQGAGDRYRVEVLVLKHLEYSEQPEEVMRIEDYSSALDFLTPATEADSMPGEACDPTRGEIDSMDEMGAVAAPLPGAEVAGEQLPEEDGLAAGEIEEEADPNAVVHVEEMGPEMQEAWRRLRLSGPFRPLQYLAWEQGSEQPFPVL
ncbi:MAG: hypothetical protein V2I48_03055, partial [Xanthomonadales bacterium]|nr:hypothetical protein [Xanthomonadales bacterium]